MAADGLTLDSDNDVCIYGICSNNHEKIQMTEVRNQYTFCDVNIEPDEFCQSKTIILDSYSKPSLAINITFDPDYEPSPNNTN